MEWSQHLGDGVTDIFLLDLVDLDLRVYLAYIKHLLLAFTQLIGKNLSHHVHFILACLEFVDLCLLIGLLNLEGISQLNYLVLLVILVFFDDGFESVDLIEGLLTELIDLSFDALDMIFRFFLKSCRPLLNLTLRIR